MNAAEEVQRDLKDAEERWDRCSRELTADSKRLAVEAAADAAHAYWRLRDFTAAVVWASRAWRNGYPEANRHEAVRAAAVGAMSADVALVDNVRTQASDWAGMAWSDGCPSSNPYWAVAAAVDASYSCLKIEDHAGVVHWATKAWSDGFPEANCVAAVQGANNASYSCFKVNDDAGVIYWATKAWTDGFPDTNLAPAVAAAARATHSSLKVDDHAGVVYWATKAWSGDFPETSHSDAVAAAVDASYSCLKVEDHAGVVCWTTKAWSDDFPEANRADAVRAANNASLSCLKVDDHAGVVYWATKAWSDGFSETNRESAVGAAYCAIRSCAHVYDYLGIIYWADKAWTDGFPEAYREAAVAVASCAAQARIKVEDHAGVVYWATKAWADGFPEACREDAVDAASCAAESCLIVNDDAGVVYWATKAWTDGFPDTNLAPAVAAAAHATRSCLKVDDHTAVVYWGTKVWTDDLPCANRAAALIIAARVAQSCFEVNDLDAGICWSAKAWTDGFPETNPRDAVAAAANAAFACARSNDQLGTITWASRAWAEGFPKSHPSAAVLAAESASYTCTDRKDWHGGIEWAIRAWTDGFPEANRRSAVSAAACATFACANRNDQLGTITWASRAWAEGFPKSHPSAAVAAAAHATCVCAKSNDRLGTIKWANHAWTEGFPETNRRSAVLAAADAAGACANSNDQPGTVDWANRAWSKGYPEANPRAAVSAASHAASACVNCSDREGAMEWASRAWTDGFPKSNPNAALVAAAKAASACAIGKHWNGALKWANLAWTEGFPESNPSAAVLAAGHAASACVNRNDWQGTIKWASRAWAEGFPESNPSAAVAAASHATSGHAFGNDRSGTIEWANRAWTDCFPETNRVAAVVAAANASSICTNWSDGQGAIDWAKRAWTAGYPEAFPQAAVTAAANAASASCEGRDWHGAVHWAAACWDPRYRGDAGTKPSTLARVLDCAATAILHLWRTALEGFLLEEAAIANQSLRGAAYLRILERTLSPGSKDSVGDMSPENSTRTWARLAARAYGGEKSARFALDCCVGSRALCLCAKYAGNDRDRFLAEASALLDSTVLADDAPAAHQMIGLIYALSAKVAALVSSSDFRRVQELLEAFARLTQKRAKDLSSSIADDPLWQLDSLAHEAALADIPLSVFGRLLPSPRVNTPDLVPDCLVPLLTFASHFDLDVLCLLNTVDVIGGVNFQQGNNVAATRQESVLYSVCGAQAMKWEGAQEFSAQGPVLIETQAGGHTGTYGRLRKSFLHVSERYQQLGPSKLSGHIGIAIRKVFADAVQEACELSLQGSISSDEVMSLILDIQAQNELCLREARPESPGSPSEPSLIDRAKGLARAGHTVLALFDTGKSLVRAWLPACAQDAAVRARVDTVPLDAACAVYERYCKALSVGSARVAGNVETSEIPLVPLGLVVAELEKLLLSGVPGERLCLLPNSWTHDALAASAWGLEHQRLVAQAPSLPVLLLPSRELPAGHRLRVLVVAAGDLQPYRELASDLAKLACSASFELTSYLYDFSPRSGARVQIKPVPHADEISPHVIVWLVHGRFEAGTGAGSVTRSYFALNHEPGAARVTARDLLTEGAIVLPLRDQKSLRVSLSDAALVLSGACASGRSSTEGGEEGGELLRPFLAAGVRTVVAPSWNVPVTSETVPRAMWNMVFQKILVERETPSAAVRAARLRGKELTSQSTGDSAESKWAHLAVWGLGFSEIAN